MICYLIYEAFSWGHGTGVDGLSAPTRSHIHIQRYDPLAFEEHFVHRTHVCP